MGELARKPGCPKVAETPLELLTPRPGEDFVELQRRLWMAAAAFTGFASSVVYNFTRRRPWWSGVPRHVVLSGLTCGVGHVMFEGLYASRAETDAILKHYISLHPDDFPPFERKRWGEIYKPFVPTR